MILLRASTLTTISAATVAASTVGSALLAGLLPTRPELLLALSPGNLILLLVANRLSFATYYAIGVSRLVLSDIAPYLLGYLHGRRGVELVIRRQRHRRFIGEHTTRMKPVALVALFLSASAVVSALSGLAQIRPGLFIALDLLGSTVRLVLIWWLAALFATQLDVIGEIIEDWQRYLLAIGVGIAVVSFEIRRRRAARPDPLVS